MICHSDNLFAKTNQDSTIFYTWKNSEMFDITSKRFGIFNNTPSENRVVDIKKGSFEKHIPLRIIISFSERLDRFINATYINFK